VLGMAEYRLKQYREAIPHLQQALDFPDFRPQALGMMADAYAQLGMPAQAMEVYRKIDGEGVADPQALFQLGNDAAARGDDDASIQYFQRFLAAVPDNPAAHFNLASSLFRKHDYTNSLQAAERCVALSATPQVQASCLLLAADNLVATGRREEAFAHFEKARALDPNNPRIKRQ
jgi:tetratricopeptide (TPR) repeat protein